MMRLIPWVCVLAGLAMAGTALAEPSQYTAPTGKVMDPNGVDLTSGQYNRSDTFLTIGDPANGGLAWTYTGHSNTDNYTGELFYVPNVGATPEEYRVKIAGSTDTFTMGVNNTGSAAKFEETTSNWLYTDRSGIVYTFDKLTIDQPTYSVIRKGKLVSITYPNGNVVTINHEYSPSCTANTQTCDYRIKSVVSNRGYAFKYEYETAVFARLDVIRAVNRATYYCDDLINACTAYDNAITFDHPNSGLTFKVTDAMGGATEFGTTSSNVFDTEVINYVKQPDGWEISVTYDTYGRVTSLTNPEGTWNYSYSDNTLTAVQNMSQARTVTVKDSANATFMTMQVNKSLMLPLKTTNALGKDTTYTLTSYQNIYSKKWGRIVSVAQPEGNKATYTYDTRGNLTSVTDTPKTGSGLSTKTVNIAYDSNCSNYVTCNQPNSVQDAKGNYTYLTYDATHGGTTSVAKPADSAGLTPKTVTTYAQFTAQIKNSSGILVNAGTVWLPQTVSTCRTAVTCDTTVNQTKTTTTYDTPNLLPTTVTMAAGDNSLLVATTKAYDSVGNAVSVDGPLSGTGDQTFRTYDANRRLVYDITADPDGSGALVRSMTKKVYDNMGRVTQLETGTGSSTTGTDFDRKAYVATQYNARGTKDQVAAYIDGNAIPESLTQFSYDIRGGLLCTTVRMNMGVAPGADPCALNTEGSFGPDRITKNTYNAAGQLIQIDQAYGTSIQRAYARYSYTDNGLKATEKDANDNMTTLEYDGFDRLKKLRYPSTSIGASASSTTDYEEFAYDANGNKTSWRRRDGQIFSYTYDNLNREIVRDVPGTTTKDIYTIYDLQGRILWKKFGSTSGTGVSYVYDALGRMSSTTDVNGRTLNYSYNSASARTQLTYPDSQTIGFGVDTQNRMTSASWNGTTSLFSLAYDSLGRRISLTRTGGSTSYGYDDAGRLTSYGNNLFGTSHDVTWSFVTEGVPNYNPAGQLLVSSTTSTVYDYEELTSSTVNQTYDGLNRDAAVAAVSGGYDARGNLTTDGTRNFTYDVENRLLTATGGAASLTLDYDPEGRLSKYTSGSTVTEFLYDGVNLIGEYNAAGTVLRRYVHGTAADEPIAWLEGTGISTQRSFYQNYQGSVVAWTSASGLAQEIYKYGPYGESLVAAGSSPSAVTKTFTGARFRYTGQLTLPEASLYYYKARVYDPYYGKFLQTDPIGSKDDLNLYAYVSGDPINHNDPTGTELGSYGPNLEYYAPGDNPNGDPVQGLIGLGGLGASFLAPLVVVEGSATWLSARSSYSATRNALTAAEKTSLDGIRRTWQGSITKIQNIINNNGKFHDFLGAARETKGIKTGFDHVTEMKNSITGLQKAAESIAGTLKNPNLSAQARASLEAWKKAAETAIKEMSKMIE
jgi:RHS repeat-associated protein